MGNTVVDTHERNIQRWLHHVACRVATPPILTGRLVTLPIRGIGYRTSTQRGVTNGHGEFRYLPGERVTFFIGNADFPVASAGPAVTPYDMGTTRNEPINVARLLHSVRTESIGTLSIPAFVTQWASSPIDFAVAPCVFAQQPAVAKMMG